MASSANSSSKVLEGGCLCEAVRYKISFPKDHDLSKDSLGCICQCTQCRKQTGSFFLATLNAPVSAIEWQGDSEDKIKRYRKSENIARGFCGDCGSFLFWHPNGRDVSIAIGSLDPLYLFGEGVEDKSEVPTDGFAKEIFSGHFKVEFCESEIKGVTDDMPILHKGQRYQGDSSNS
ncbi:glutathione-dependent formaldehyde-activating gfa [Fusarium denticulatum]|uniref:Glutathione-dependent formaldehyde-activating gfa n=1 Tax=Fusarium denticulatum TaxID=48507 RepID=A0A8H5XFN5_9HYPO|nr:glutathione-dependent formaldehyde-activating gfa [Fusarium denticulatum]